MNKYEQYLRKVEVLSREEFNKIADLFPDVDINSIDVYDYRCSSTEVAEAFATVYLEEFDCAWVKDIDIENKIINICDVQSLEDLRKIKEKFSRWEIGNYKELLEVVEEIEYDNESNEEYFEKCSILIPLIEKLSIEEVKEIFNKYGNKKNSPQACS